MNVHEGPNRQCDGLNGALDCDGLKGVLHHPLLKLPTGWVTSSLGILLTGRVPLHGSGAMTYKFD